MNIHKATVEDAPALVQLYDTVWQLEIEALGEKLATERRADQPTVEVYIRDETYFVVDIEGRIVAVIGCEERHGSVHLVHLVTHPDHRGKGYAEALMKRAETFAKETGAAKIWFDTAPGLTAPQRLYSKLGYEKCGYFKKHYWGTDLILYEKIIR